MFKTTAGSKLARTQGGGAGVRGRDAEFPSAPVHVSDDAQARALDINTIRQFNFNQPDRTVIPERPSTSGGPGPAANFSMRRNAEKRVTKDDLYFNPPASHGKPTTFYNFPLPGSLPTPTGPPEASSPPPRQSSLGRPFTPESIDTEQHMNAPQMEIGMAIGSPTHQPATWQPQRLQQMRSPSPDPLEESLDDRVPPTPAKQKSKWKMFGGLFGGSKKQSPAQGQNFYQLQPENTHTETESHVRFEESSEQPKRGRGRTNSERKVEKKKPDVKRANTAPQRFDLHPIRAERNPEILLDGNHLDDSVIQGGGLMLNVDIPSVEMERYSVMFGTLLQKQPNSTSSLLARRQATLDRLKTVNEELALKEKELEAKAKLIKQPRRATSPQPTRSPAFSLFPNTPSRDSRLGRMPSPNSHHTTLHRSNTSPAALSPSRPSFAPGPDNEIHATLLEPGPHIPNGYESDHSTYQSATIVTKSNTIKKKQDLRSAAVAAASQTPPQQTARIFTTEQSHLTLSPDSDVYDPAPLPMKPQLVEPAWQMITKPSYTPASVSGSTTSHSDHSTSASASSISTSTSTTPHSASSSTQKSSQTTSPQSQSTAIAMPIPISKLSHTSSPQAQTTKSRARSATTNADNYSQSQLPRPNTARRNPSETSNISLNSVALSAIIPPPTNLSSTTLNITTPHTQGSKLIFQEQDNEEHEAHLKTLADVSIARQISVSRQQRQLLIPIKGSVRGKSTTNQNGRARAATESSSYYSATEREHQRHNQNFPSPLQGLKDLKAVNVGQVTSPLGAVEIATMEKRDREQQRENASQGRIVAPGAGIVEKKERRERKERKERERLVEGVKPNTPTLVIVAGSDLKEEERNWDGVVASAPEPTKMGIAERRRRARAGGEPGVGLSVGTGHERRGHEYRKSEKVIVERVSAYSDRP